MPENKMWGGYSLETGKWVFRKRSRKRAKKPKLPKAKWLRSRGMIIWSADKSWDDIERTGLQTEREAMPK